MSAIDSAYSFKMPHQRACRYILIKQLLVCMSYYVIKIVMVFTKHNIKYERCLEITIFESYHNLKTLKYGFLVLDFPGLFLILAYFPSPTVKFRTLTNK